MAGSWLDTLSDAAGDLGASIMGSAGDFVKGKVKSALPDTQPANHTGETGTGKASAAPAGQQTGQGMPGWALPAAGAVASALALAVIVALLRK